MPNELPIKIPSVFGELKGLQLRMWEELVAVPADAKTEISIDALSGRGRVVEAAFLRWFLLDAIPAFKTSAQRFVLRNTLIHGELDLEGTKPALLLRFISCKFPRGVKLNDAEIAGLEFSAGFLHHVYADRLTASGPLTFRSVTEHLQKRGIGLQIGDLRIHETVYLSGAKIGGNLDFRGCHLLGEPPPEGQKNLALLADGLSVEGNVLLNGGFSARGEIRLNGCHITRNLDCSGATLENPGGVCLLALGSQFDGAVFLCRTHEWEFWSEPKPFCSKGTVRLERANILGDLDCRGGKFTAPCYLQGEKSPEQAHLNVLDPTNVVALDVTGATIAAKLRLEGVEKTPAPDEAEGRFVATGQIRLVKATIGGDLICRHADFNMPRGDCVLADLLTVGNATYLGPGLRTDGFIRLMQATLKGGLYANGISFNCNKPRDGWKGWKIVVNRSSAFDLKDKSATNADLKDRAAGGIYAPFATIGMRFQWRDNGKIVKTENNWAGDAWLYLFGTKIDEIEDDIEDDHRGWQIKTLNDDWTEAEPPVWQTIDRFDITNCAYDCIADLKEDVRHRLGQLDSQYAILNAQSKTNPTVDDRKKSRGPSIGTVMRAFGHSIRRPFAFMQVCNLRQESSPKRKMDNAIKRFAPQPYLQLARVVREAGFEGAATRVLVRLERNRTVYGDLGSLEFLGRVILDIFLKYGYSQFRPLRILLGWFWISVVVFEVGFFDGVVIPTKDNSSVASEVQSCVASARDSKVAAASCPTPDKTKKQTGQAPTPKPAIEFNALVFSLETLVPLVDLNQKKNWTVEPLSHTKVPAPASGLLGFFADLINVWQQFPDSLPSFFLLFNAFFGWFLGISAAAGVSGLLRNDSGGK